MGAERLQDDHNLVTLYAERVQCWGRVPAVRELRPPPRPIEGVHRFGRKANTPRTKLSLRRRTAIPALVATALAVGPSTVSAAVTHEVQPGETLSSIAEQYGTTVEHLALINDIGDPDFVRHGDLLTIESQAALENARQHMVQPGETLSGIAARYGVTADVLAQLNNITEPEHIVPGQNLVVANLSPNATGLPVADGNGASLHLVVTGETLSGIAARYGVSVEALAETNRIENPDRIESGQLLSIPAGGPTRDDGLAKLRGMPIMHQSLPLSCEAAAVSMATAYWGGQISEWVLIENMPSHPNPHYGFRGDITGAFGGTNDYGVYAEPFVPILDRYGFASEVFYADGNADLLKQQINQGRPLVVWMTNMASVQPRGYESYDGERFALVPQEHAVVVYGYDDQSVYVADPGDAQYRSFSWDEFMRSWGYFDGMSLAIYPR